MAQPIQHPPWCTRTETNQTHASRRITCQPGDREPVDVSVHLAQIGDKVTMTCVVLRVAEEVYPLSLAQARVLDRALSSLLLAAGAIR